MAPTPVNKNAPKAQTKKKRPRRKAPDKSDKKKVKSAATISDHRTQDLEITTLASVLGDVELKALLNEVIKYKIPKDGRKARSTSGNDLESVRYDNYSATRRNRRRRQPYSPSENLTDGGSLNNLTNEELYTAASHLHDEPETVSTRQGQGGSLPCNLNSGVLPSYDKQFFEDARRKIENQKEKYTAIDMESESLLEHDALNQNSSEQSETKVVQTRIPLTPVKFTSRFNLDIGNTGEGGSNVDDMVTMAALACAVDKITDEVIYKPMETVMPATHYPPVGHYGMLVPSPVSSSFNRKSVEDKKVDENGTALDQSNSGTKKNKKKKKQIHKNVVVLEAKDVAGHRGDIIDDLDKLVEYIGGNEEQTGAKSKSNVHKAKLHKQRFSSSGEAKSTNYNKKQWMRSKGKPVRMQKSSSMEDISINKLDNFRFSQECAVTKAPLRSTISNIDQPRERRSWNNSESVSLHASAENLDTAIFQVVTKEKKCKKRRNSLSGRRLPYLRELHDYDFNRVPSPEARVPSPEARVPSPETRGKSTCSVPHSDKSNDLLDIGSVHSMPIDNSENSANLNLPISCVSIAKNSNPLERPKWNRLPSERVASQSKTSVAETLDSMEVEQEKVQTPPKVELELICTLPPRTNDLCNNFMMRYFVPETFQNYNHDEAVNFIALAWEDTISELNQANGRVKYYIDQSADEAGPNIED